MPAGSRNSPARPPDTDFTRQLRVLEAAAGHPARLALATIDLVYAALPESERTALKESLEGVLQVQAKLAQAQETLGWSLNIGRESGGARPPATAHPSTPSTGAAATPAPGTT